MQGKIGNTLLSNIKAQATPFEVNDSLIKGFLLRVQPSGVISYYATYRNSNRKRQRVLLGRYPAISPVQARDYARKVIAQVVQGEDPAQQKKTSKALTLREFIENDYKRWVTSHRKDGKASVDRIQTCFAKFADLKLSEIKPIAIERWRSHAKATKKAASINRDLAALKSALTKAVEWGFVEENPLRSIKPFKLDHNAVVRYLTDDEEIRLRAALDHREARLRSNRDSANQWRRERDYPMLPDLNKVPFADHLKPMVLLSINTGLRQGELFQLEWKNVDLARANLTISGEHSKNGKTRHIPLNKESLQTLKSWQSQQTDTLGLVFPNGDGKRFDNVTKAWHSVLNVAEIVKFRWHDLRHHFASRLVMASVDLNTVRELLGHSDIKMTLRYAHLAPEHKSAAVAKLERSK